MVVGIIIGMGREAKWAKIAKIDPYMGHASLWSVLKEVQ
jgi:hypothetical protein